jgi:hypothetical protein
MNRFWMVYVEGQRSPTFHHWTEKEARIEAERLAKLPENEGREVFVLSSIASCRYNAVNWSDGWMMIKSTRYSPIPHLEVRSDQERKA